METTQSEQPQIVDTELRAWIRKLDSVSPSERAKAERYISSLGPAGVQPVLTALLQKEKFFRWNSGWDILRVVGGVVLLLLLVILAVVSPVRALISLLTSSDNSNYTDSWIGRYVRQYADVRDIGLLALALEHSDSIVRSMAIGTLLRLLPQIKASDTNLLDADQRRCLYRALRGWTPSLIIAILKAFEQIGDEKALPYVQRLANGSGAAARNDKVRAAARQCLPFLEQRATVADARKSLLRASDTASATSVSLLRATSEVKETEPAQLLRAATYPDLVDKSAGQESVVHNHNLIRQRP